MRLIVLTMPDGVADEARHITRMLDSGIEQVNLRHPAWDLDRTRRLIESIEPRLHCRLVLHDHFSLVADYALRGLHLSGRHPEAPRGYSGYVECACHSLAELPDAKRRSDMAMLSPVFDSISKPGYLSRYSPDALARAHRDGLIDERVCALGGVRLASIPQLTAWGFGAAAMMGEAWK